MSKDRAKLSMTVRGCARCNEDHEQLVFLKLGQPCQEWTHWAVCPTTNEPILLTFDAKE